MILELIAITSLFVLGLDFASQYDPAINIDETKGEYREILWWYRYWLWKLVGETALYKPLIGCPVCMSSVYGTLMFWTLYSHHLNTTTLIQWAVTVAGAAGLTRLLLHLLNR
jgi:hypothetical protein